MSKDPDAPASAATVPGLIALTGEDRADPRKVELVQEVNLARHRQDVAAKEIQVLRRELEEANLAARSGRPAVRPVATPARMHRRHYGVMASFVATVCLPVALVAGYLYTAAEDQYASTLAFTVRSEDISSSAADILGGIGAGLAGGGGSTGADADILYEFMHSPDLVRRVDDRLDLRTIYGTDVHADPVFGFDPGGTIEDLTAYWSRMVQVNYDTGSRLMEVTALAFTPQDARSIAEALFAESSAMINNLSEVARADATRYAREDLDTALERLKSAREALTQFRVANQIVDPSADIQSQMGLLASLQAQQTEVLIELDLLTDSTRPGDPRLDQTQRRLAVIEARIAEERRKFGADAAAPGNTSYANTVSEYERIAVDREFAERAYASALSAFDTAKAEANRQSRYLATYITPTLAEQAEYPKRLQITLTAALFAFLAWVVGVLVFYALRERR